MAYRRHGPRPTWRFSDWQKAQDPREPEVFVADLDAPIGETLAAYSYARCMLDVALHLGYGVKVMPGPLGGEETILVMN